VRDKPKLPKTDKGSDRTFSIDWASPVKVTAAFILAAVLFVLLERNTQETKWSSTSGTIQATRIVADHAVQTQAGGHITWKAEYSVAYSVRSREYAIWADSGVGAKAKTVFAWPCRARSLRVGCGTRPKLPEYLPQTADERRPE
jgi:hypothetical protein